jgi:glycosyltransferase involved in cell wall biosynthesis
MPSSPIQPGSKRRLIIIGPLPPPTHGVAISTGLALANTSLRDRFDVEHIDTTDPRPLANIGAWDVMNVFLGLRGLARLIRRLRGRKGVVYLTLSENLGGFLRDSLFIHAAALANWNIAVHIRNSTFRDFYGARGVLARWWIRRTLRRISGLAVLGNRLRPLFDGFVAPERISVVPNGTPDVARNSFERDQNFVLYLSNFLEEKGIVEAVEAALIVVERNPDARVLFVGEWIDGALEQELRARAESAGDRIKFRPPAFGEEKERLLQSCSVLLFPPKWGEGHPRIVLEAICRATPLVTTNRATIPETVTDGESAFIVDYPEPRELADRVLQLLEDDTLREAMGRAARARYEANYSQPIADQRLAAWLTGVDR